MYKEEDLVCIAKRENNNKRNYLVVNKLQGKHIPVNPTKSFEMFEQLAEILRKEYSDERLLLVGFAETATAIGAGVATKLQSYYMQTTRENIEDVEYLFFSEAHSHATEQKLIKTDLDTIIDSIDRIVFIEDEVTTGNTILNIVNIIESKYGHNIMFAVASLLNGMNQESQKEYLSRNINTHYLVKTNHDKYAVRANEFEENGTYYPCDLSTNNMDSICVKEVHGYMNARRLVSGKDYLNACQMLWNEVDRIVGELLKQNILVIGTEEFMYPALYIAAKFAENNIVKCHSTTRSPIAVNSDEEYPLHTRYELVSMYDDARRTFIYDLDKYDKVIILTDSGCLEQGRNCLANAISSVGNKDISIIRWC